MVSRPRRFVYVYKILAERGTPPPPFPPQQGC